MSANAVLIEPPARTPAEQLRRPRAAVAPPRLPPRSTTRLLEWSLVVFALLAGLTMLWWPLGHDQGIFALNGATVAAGGVPYRDTFETRGPLAFYLYALLRVLFGPTAWGVRVLDLGVALTTALLLDRVLAPFATRFGRRVAAATWVLTIVALGHQDAAQFELWIGSAVLAGVVLITREGGYRARDLAVFGGIVGLASLTKQFYPVFLAVPAIVAWQRRGTDHAGLARDVGVLVLSCAAPIVAVVLWFWSQHALRDLWETHVLYTLRVYPSYVPWQHTRLNATLMFLLRGRVVPTVLAGAAVGLMSLWRERRDLALALAAWLVCGLFAVELQNRFFLYHWTVLFPALAVLVAVGCARAVREGGVGRWLGIAVGASVVAQTVLTPAEQLQQWIGYVTHAQSANEYFSRFAVWQTNPADERDAAHYLQSRTRPGQPLGMWAVDAAVPFLADRPNVTRIAERRTYLFAPQHAMTQQYRAEFVRDVRERRPPFFIVNLRTEGDERPLPVAFPALGALVAERYVHDTTFGSLEVLRLRPDPTTADRALRAP